MSPKNQMQAKIENLCADYHQLTGKPFNHFFCPILFRDEVTELCKAHIVNKAFSTEAAEWTVQRKDVDNFFGSMFEGDFVDIQHKGKDFEDILVDNPFSQGFTRKILLNEKPVEHYLARDESEIPKRFTPLRYEGGDGKSILFGLKMAPQDVYAALDQKWEFELFKDTRIPALVSLIKAAHLSLFEMIGYRYALSASGYFVGQQILGEFYRQNCGKPKSKILENARLFFREYGHIARPAQTNNFNLQGTIADRTLCICKGFNGPDWAFIVFIKTAEMLNAVLIPIFEQVDAVSSFLGFLKNENETLEVSFCRFEQNRWEVNPKTTTMDWPKTGILYPE